MTGVNRVLDIYLYYTKFCFDILIFLKLYII